jgi:AraC family transcriptional regulator
MRRETLDKKTRIANDIMFYIYTNIDTDINMDELAQDFGISKFYMHKLFKEIFSRNIYESIKSIRLQKASNLLLTNRYSTITQIAASCGYSSQTSFIRVFKERFSMTPKAWRNGGYKEYSQTLLAKTYPTQHAHVDFEQLEPTIVKMPSFESYYIRHRGYGPEVKQVWQQLKTWIFTNDIQNYKKIALFHDNPAITPLEECHYVACVSVDEEEEFENERLPKFNISEGVYARFDLKGYTGDLLRFIHWIYHVWLPRSEYETTTKPPYAIYTKNRYLTEGEDFELSFYLSIKF